MRNFIFFLTLFFATPANSQTLKIAAAGSLRYIIEDIKLKYSEKHPNTKILITIGASGQLAQQIIHGAGFDFFMSADNVFPTKLQALGLVDGQVRIYAYGRLAIWSNMTDVSKGIQVVKDKNVARISIAKPEIAPYGERAVQCLKYYNLFEGVKNKLVYADNIAQAAQFAETGNAELAIIAYSLILGSELKNKGSYYIVDSKSYKPLDQACVILKKEKQNPEAEKFMNFVLSSYCTPIFEKYGFTIP